MSYNEGSAASNPGAVGEQYDFKVDFKELVRVLSEKLYPEASAVIRELLKNAHDSLSRLSKEYGFSGQEPEIRIWLDQAGRLRVRDNGIGMSKVDLTERLSKIGAGFREADSNLFGQYGVGFLSSFKVAKLNTDNAVIVETRQSTEQEGYRWCSLKKEHPYDHDYVIEPAPGLEIGTTVIIDLNAEFRQKWDEKTLKRIVLKEAGNFALPIYWGPQGSIKLNELQAPWYDDKPLTDKDTERVREYLVEFDPRFASAESASEIIPLYSSDGVRGIVYIPSPTDLKPEMVGGMDLYCRRVFVKENDLEILPEEFYFARGVIDCPKFNTTLANNDVFHDPIYRSIYELIGTQMMGHFRKLANRATNQASQVDQLSAGTKDEIAGVRLQAVLGWYHILFKHILVQKAENGQYRFESACLTDFEHFMPFQSSEPASTSIPDYLARVEAVGHERELLILHPDDKDYMTYLALAQAQKRELILIRTPVEEDYLLRYAQIRNIKVLPATDILTRMPVITAPPAANEGWQIILKFFQERLDHQEMSLSASLTAFDPLPVAGRLLTNKDSKGMRDWKELIEKLRADKTIDQDSPAFKYVEALTQKIPYSLYINTGNPVLERLADLLQRRVDVDADLILHSIFHDIAMAGGHPFLESHVAEYHNKVYMEALAGVDTRVEYRRLQSKLADTQKILDDAQDEFKQLKSASPAPDTTNEVFFIRPMHHTDFNHNLVSRRLAGICRNSGLELIDPAERHLPADILREIIEFLQTSRLVVADISETTNANVFYEVGYVHGRSPEKLILVAHQTVVSQVKVQLPIDLITQRILPYNDGNVDQFDDFINQLEEAVQDRLASQTKKKAVS